MALFDPKAKNIATYQKSIDEKRTSITRYYDEIGRFYYNQYKDINVDNTKDINTRCEAITRLTNEIGELNVKILYEKGLKLCGSCGVENDLKHLFCYKCGARFDTNGVEAASTATETSAVVAAPSEETSTTEAPVEG